MTQAKALENDGCRILAYKKMLKAHKEYYDRECHGADGDMVKSCSILIQPAATILALIILILFIAILSDLLNMDRSKFTDKSQMELLFTLVPTVALLFGSLYKSDFFFKDFHFVKDGEDKEPKESEGSKKKSEEPNESTPLLRNIQYTC